MLTQRRLWHATRHVLRLFVLPKGDDGMPCLTSFNRVCCPKAMMAWHAQRFHIVCVVHGRFCHATLDVADRVCCPRAVMSCHTRCCPPCVLSKGGDVKPRPTSSYRVCCPRAVMSCHVRRCRPCVLSKGGDVMPRPTLPTVCVVQGRCCHATPDVANRVCGPRAVMSSFHV